MVVLYVNIFSRRLIRNVKLADNLQYFPRIMERAHTHTHTHTHTQGLYNIARSAGAVLFSNHVIGQFSLSSGQLVTEKLFGLQVVPDNTTVTKGSVAVGFDCGAPPEPAVSGHYIVGTTDPLCFMSTITSVVPLTHCAL